ncbi:putative Zn-dependent protease with MMP-like domain [Mycoplasmoides fastidiosum]|uniref:Zn-dependent protease with MMP-like domain n=1 Tax=Mycoplasmoides fastidiosum TaxID=92758 RepID=A0ABU0LY73_9BACT|nr:lipoprotein 17-related variable surface protein [Mycoplasmoides fastidiosum]MDQ0513644.1 putative Zn-dependent protease with MMP-like domain [Mycoplasmoides fastidiosum]UUD37936.1 lipoprotein 17-related variable surface protein [Mycoplasmoides fastidiosum]
MTQRKVKLIKVFFALLATLSTIGLGAKLLINPSPALIAHHSGLRTVHHTDATVVDAAETGTHIYRPSSLTFTTDKDTWNQNDLVLPSQVTAEKLRSILTIVPQNSADGTATATTSGYKFQKINTNNPGTYDEIQNDALKTQTTYDLGQISQSNFNSAGIEIVEADDLNGTLSFRVYETLQTYTIRDGTYLRDPQATNSISSYRALILPPTNYQPKPTPAPATSTRDQQDGADTSQTNQQQQQPTPVTVDSTLWTLPDLFPLKKNQYIFGWKSDQLINDWIRNSNKRASTVSDDEIQRYFVSVLRTVDNSTLDNAPQYTINKTANDGNGQLIINIQLPAGYGNSNKSITRTFFGFTGTTVTRGAGTVLNTLSEQILINSIIRQPVWNSGSGRNEVNYLNQQVNQLLPSEFYNVNATRNIMIEVDNPEKTDDNSKPAKINRKYNFLDLFNGVEIKSPQNGNTPAISVTEGANQTGSIGYLTFNGEKSGEGNLADLDKFEITKVEGYPNDRAGTLNLLVYFSALSENGTLIEGTPQILTYSGFRTNIDTGESLYFAWNEKIPEQYANLTAADTVNIFQEAAGSQSVNPSLTNYVDNEQAKNFVTQFFTGSEYVFKKYNERYNLAARTGAQVSLSISTTTDPVNPSLRTSNLQVQIKFAQFGQIAEQVFTKIFEPNSTNTLVPISLQATLRPNPNFSFRGHIYSSKLASELTLDEIKNLFNFRIPEGGSPYTSSLSDATFFYAANDRLGELSVSIIFPKFNNIEQYQFSYKFNNFKINDILRTKLELNFTPLINLSADFLSRDPTSIVSLTPKDILDNLFNNLPEQIFKLLSENNIRIVERGTDYVIVEVNVNWNDLTNQAINVGPSNPAQQQSATRKILHEDETPANPFDQVIRFRIDGFIGGTNALLANNQSPKVPDDVLNHNQIIIVGAAIGSGLFTIIVLTGLYVLVRNLRLRRSEFLKSDDTPPVNRQQKNKTKGGA